MTTHTATGLETPAHRGKLVSNEVITARIIRDENGENHRIYRMNGRAYSSVDALQAALEDT